MWLKLLWVMHVYCFKMWTTLPCTSDLRLYQQFPLLSEDLHVPTSPFLYFETGRCPHLVLLEVIVTVNVCHSLLDLYHHLNYLDRLRIDPLKSHSKEKVSEVGAAGRKWSKSSRFKDISLHQHVVELCASFRIYSKPNYEIDLLKHEVCKYKKWIYLFDHH